MLVHRPLFDQFYLMDINSDNLVRKQTAGNKMYVSCASLHIWKSVLLARCFFCFVFHWKNGSSYQRLFHLPRSSSASSIVISSSLSFAWTWWKQKKRYFSSDLWKVAHDHIHRRYQPSKKLFHPRRTHLVVSGIRIADCFKEWTANIELTYTHFSL